MDSVLFAAAAGAFFGGMAVAVRVGLRRCPDPLLGALAAILVAAAASAFVAAASSASLGDLEPRELWPFVLVGAAVPGASQLVFVRAIRDIGPSRTAILIGTAPLISVALAVAFLDESLGYALGMGTLAIITGSALLAWEPTRPAHYRLVGAAFALGAAALFAVRDNVVRWVALDTEAHALVAATASLGGAAALLTLVELARRRVPGERRGLRSALLPFAPAGVLLALAYGSLLVALDRGPVTVVAPLNGTQAFWAVAVAAVVVGRSEGLGRRLLLGAALIVGGGALIGAFR